MRKKAKRKRSGKGAKSFNSHHEEIEFPLALVDIVSEVAVKGHKQIYTIYLYK